MTASIVWRRLFDPGDAPMIPKRWTDLPRASLVWLFMEALRDIGGIKVFTLLVTKPTQNRMVGSPLGPTKFLAQRMRHHLTDVPWFFVTEISQARVIHIHGALATSPANLADVADALKRVAGDHRKLTTKIDRQFHTKRSLLIADPAPVKKFRGKKERFGWGEYTLKDWTKTKKLLGSEGSLLSVSRSLKRRAREVFEEIAKIE